MDDVPPVGCPSNMSATLLRSNAHPTVLFSMIHTGTMLHSKWDIIAELWHEEAVTSRYFTKDARLANGTVAIVLMGWIIFSSFANFRKM